MTGRENHQFAMNIANRMWKKMMGHGIVEPIDDFRDENKPSHPELLEHLTAEVLRLNFDLRQFIRIIANTQTYQRLAVVHDAASNEPFHFARPGITANDRRTNLGLVVDLGCLQPVGLSKTYGQRNCLDCGIRSVER